MGFLSRLLSPGNGIKTLLDPAGQAIRTVRGVPTTGGTMLNPLSGQTDSQRNAAYAANNPTYGPPGLPGSQGGLGTGGMPMQNQPPLQLPQMQPGQLPQFLPNPQGFGQGGGMPFVRDHAMMNTLAPFFQQNYGVPFISPYGQNGGMGGGLGQPQGVPPGANPGTMPYQPPPPPGFGMPGRVGLQPFRGAIG